MKKLALFIIVLALCSCSDAYKAKRFAKNIEKKGYSAMCNDVCDDGAYVYYKDDYFNYYKYDVRAEKSSKVLNVNKDEFLYDDSDSKIGKVFYLKDQANVMCYDLRKNKETCVNKNETVEYEFLFAYRKYFMFCNYKSDVDCNERLIYFDAMKNSFQYVCFNNINSDHRKSYYPTCFFDDQSKFLINLSPGTEDKNFFGYKDYLYSHSLYEMDYKHPKLICEAEEVWCNDSRTKVMAQNGDIVSVYNLYGTKEKEFVSIHGWPSKRGLNSGNIIAYSDEDRILCYIANDDGQFISSVNLYYYDGYTGEEVEIDNFKNYDGKTIRFVMNHQAQRDIKLSIDEGGLVFYGETDWGNEYTLFFFSFEDRSTRVIDRGRRVEFIRDRFKVLHHNETESWYNINGQEVEARTWVDDWSDSFYDAGAQLGEMLNALME